MNNSMFMVRFQPTERSKSVLVGGQNRPIKPVLKTLRVYFKEVCYDCDCYTTDTNETKPETEDIITFSVKVKVSFSPQTVLWFMFVTNDCVSCFSLYPASPNQNGDNSLHLMASSQGNDLIRIILINQCTFSLLTFWCQNIHVYNGMMEQYPFVPFCIYLDKEQSQQPSEHLYKSGKGVV